MEDPLPMARVILEKEKGDIKAAIAFARRQQGGAKTTVLNQFWGDVIAVLEQAKRNPGKVLKRKAS